MQTQIAKIPADGAVEEQRRSPRVDVDMTAELTVGGQAPVPAQVTNLSVTGCYVRTPSPPPVDSRCEVRIFHRNDRPAKFLEVAGRVAHRQREGFGMEFTVVDSQTQKTAGANRGLSPRGVRTCVSAGSPIVHRLVVLQVPPHMLSLPLAHRTDGAWADKLPMAPFIPAHGTLHSCPGHPVDRGVFAELSKC